VQGSTWAIFSDQGTTVVKKASMTFVDEFLAQSATQRPEKVALVCDGRRWTYAELDRKANQFAHALQARGVGRGDRVVLYLNNQWELVVGLFAVLKAGGVFVPINYTTKPDKLLYILNNCQAVALLSDTRRLNQPWAESLRASVPTLRSIWVCGDGSDALERPDLGWYALEAAMAERVSVPLPRCIIDLDLACLIYTSGSTGDPKGVMSDHSNVVFAAQSIIRYLENVADDVVLNVLPLSFDYGLYQLLMTFCFGGTLILESSFAYPAAILQRMVDERVTGFPGVPTVFAMILKMDLSPYDLSHLRYVSNTAAALPPSHVLALREKFPQARLYSMYGLTETKRTLYLPPAWLEKKPGSVGIAIPGTEVWIEGDDGQRLGPGAVGELVARGRHVMRGYWQSPEATAQRFRPGPIPGERLCYTGDLFRMDEDGCMYFVGRKDDIIKSRGEKVAPKEVENVLHALAGVQHAAVIGVPDPILGQAIKEVVVPSDPTLTPAKILAHCRAHLEDFMIPKLVELRDALPLTASGKVDKKELR
jgi:long-chain acyl-CoA synthetase